MQDNEKNVLCIVVESLLRARHPSTSKELKKKIYKVDFFAKAVVAGWLTKLLIELTYDSFLQASWS